MTATNGAAPMAVIRLDGRPARISDEMRMFGKALEYTVWVAVMLGVAWALAALAGCPVTLGGAA